MLTLQGSQVRKAVKKGVKSQPIVKSYSTPVSCRVPGEQGGGWQGDSWQTLAGR